MEINGTAPTNIILQTNSPRKQGINANTSFGLAETGTEVQADQKVDLARPDNQTAQQAAIQNARLISETLTSLTDTSTSQGNSLLIDETPAILAAAGVFQNLTPIQQNEFLLNETLLNLTFDSSNTVNSLLIDETPAFLIAGGFLEDLNPLQENALLLNENLQNINFDFIDNNNFSLPGSPAFTEEITTDVQIAGPPRPGEGPAVIAAPAETTLATTAAAPATENTELFQEIASVLPVVEGTVTAPSSPAPLPESAAVDPASLPFLLNPDRTPYVLAAYETKEQNILAGEPAPPSTEVQPVAPIEPSRHIDELVSSIVPRREGRRGARGRYETPPAMPIKSVQHVLKEANDDLINRGSPIHLVLAQHETGFVLDVYDCSFPNQCILKYDIPLEPAKLPTILDNISHETGIIINTSS